MADREVALRAVGRYLVYDEIAAGGMASVHFGRMTGAAGFARAVAIKRLHPQFAKDPEFVSMFIDEARLAARIAHPNVVSTIDIVNDDGEMLLIMEYVFGASLSYLLQKTRAKADAMPVPIAAAIMVGALHGLQAAHEAKSDAGEFLGVVHRDVSPQNILVGVDGVARVVDFGIAKAVGRLQTTREGQVKGKSSYMAPEQIRGLTVDCRTDVYAASVVLWEALAGERLFAGDHPMATMNAVFEKPVPRVSEVRPDIASAVADIVARGLARDAAERFPTARAMAIALEAAVALASTREVGDWVRAEAAEMLARRAQRAAEIESSSGVIRSPTTGTPVSASASLESDVQTDASHISDVKPRRRGGWVLAGVVAGIVFAAALCMRWLLPHPPVAATAPQAQETAVPPSSPTAMAPPASASSTDAVSSPSPADAAAPASSRADRPVVRPRFTGHPRSTMQSTQRCDPPYTLDADGTRHWKSGC